MIEAKASASKQKVLVRYEQRKVSFQQMIEAVDRANESLEPEDL